MKAAEVRFRTALQRQLGVLASKNVAVEHSSPAHGRRSNLGMDITWITGRIAVGGGIWTSENMAEVARAGITHVIDMQIEFDDTPLAEPHGIRVLWNPTDDDFQPKSPDLFQVGVDFALDALESEYAKVFIHCAAGVHRAPMMTLAVLCSQGWDLEDAIQTISSRRPVVDFADVYVDSVEKYLQEQVRTGD
jgi:protein-tyrosine phosphatase